MSHELLRMFRQLRVGGGVAGAFVPLTRTGRKSAPDHQHEKHCRSYEVFHSKVASGTADDVVVGDKAHEPRTGQQQDARNEDERVFAPSLKRIKQFLLFPGVYEMRPGRVPLCQRCARQLSLSIATGPWLPDMHRLRRPTTYAPPTRDCMLKRLL